MKNPFEGLSEDIIKMRDSVEFLEETMLNFRPMYDLCKEKARNVTPITVWQVEECGMIVGFYYTWKGVRYGCFIHGNSFLETSPDGDCEVGISDLTWRFYNI